MSNPYYSFKRKGWACEISTPHTPAPWYNCLFNREYVSFVSQTGLGESSSLDRYRIASNLGNQRYWYVRDRESGEFWGSAYEPVQRKPDYYVCTHTPASTTITTEYDQIRTSHRFFVPTKGRREYFTTTLENVSDRRRVLSLFCYLPLCAWGGGFGSRGEYHSDFNAITCSQHPYYATMDHHEDAMSQQRVLSVICDETPHSWDTSERSFLGSCGAFHKPRRVLEGEMGRSRAAHERCGAGFEWRMELAPGARKTVNQVLITNDFKADVIAAVREAHGEITTPGYCDAELQKVEAFWKDLLTRDEIASPDEGLNIGANIWVKKQLVLMASTHRLSMTPGARNELQDLLGLSLFDRDAANVRQALLHVMGQQRADGYLRRTLTLNPYNPISGLGLLDFKDGQVWLPMAVAAYIKESGDLPFMDESVAFMDGSPGTVRDHILKAFEYTLNDRGQHGLPLLGAGDWNDPLSGPGKGGKGVSTWIAQAAVYAARELKPVAEADGAAPLITVIDDVIQAFAAALNEHCWNGEYYVRGFDDEGVSFGDTHCEEGQIFLNALTWGVLAGVADERQRASLFRVIDEKMTTKYGPVTVDKAFTHIDERIGKITVKAAGTSENGSIYNHAAMFKALADTFGGRGNEAFETLAAVWPGCEVIPPEVSQACPLFIPNFTMGPATGEHFGRSSHFSSTGTAAWFITVIFEHLFGVKAELDGLHIAPCLPDAWDEASITRTIRGTRYAVTFKRAAARRDRGITVNGKRITGNVVPYAPGAEVVNVAVSF